MAQSRSGPDSRGHHEKARAESCGDQSLFNIHRGDIEQRNVEALGSTLLAFGDDKLEEQLRQKVGGIRVKRVTQ